MDTKIKSNKRKNRNGLQSECLCSRDTQSTRRKDSHRMRKMLYIMCLIRDSSLEDIRSLDNKGQINMGKGLDRHFSTEDVERPART